MGWLLYISTEILIADVGIMEKWQLSQFNNSIPEMIFTQFTKCEMVTRDAPYPAKDIFSDEVIKWKFHYYFLLGIYSVWFKE